MTYYYSQKLTATTTEQRFDLPRLRSLRLLNYGNEDVTVEFEGSIDDNSITIPVNGDIFIPGDMLYFNYKSNGSSTVYIYGLRHEKI